MAVTTIRPRPPFDFTLCAKIFAGGDPAIRDFRAGIFRQPLLVSGEPVLAEVRASGTVEEPALACTITGEKPMTASRVRKAGALISRIFSTDDDLGPFYMAVAGDPVLAGLTVRFRGLRAPATLTVFEALTDSVIEQQISLAAAHRMEERLIRATGHPLVLGRSTYFCYPEPASLAGAPDPLFRACGLSFRKGEYIRDIARQITDGGLDLEALRRRRETEAIIGDLMALRGVGRWTAELTVLRGLNRPDAFPADDVGLRRLVAQYYRGGRRILAGEAREIASQWKGYEGFAAFYLVIAGLLGNRPGDPPRP